MAEDEKSEKETTSWEYHQARVPAYSKSYRGCVLKVLRNQKNTERWIFLVVEPLTSDTAYVRMHNSADKGMEFVTQQEAMDASITWTDANIKLLWWNKPGEPPGSPN